MKILVLFFSFISFCFATQNFKETRHMDALNVDRQLFGSFDILPDKMIVSYTKPNKQTITYYPNKISLQANNTTKEYSFDKYPQAQYMGVALRAIFEENYDLLSEFFDIKTEQDNKLYLTSKAGISDMIDSITIQKNSSKKIKNIFINMRNKDTILIETID